MVLSYSYQTSNPRAATNPLRSMPLIRPAHLVMGWTVEQKATFSLQVARNNLAAAETNFAAACAALGAANKLRSMRRYWQGKAMRTLNGRRAQLRQARAALAAALVGATAAGVA